MLDGGDVWSSQDAGVANYLLEKLKQQQQTLHTAIDNVHAAYDRFQAHVNVVSEEQLDNSTKDLKAANVSARSYLNTVCPVSTLLLPSLSGSLSPFGPLSRSLLSLAFMGGERGWKLEIDDRERQAHACTRE